MQHITHNQSAINFALSIWSEQIEAGLGEAGETANPSDLLNWLRNRTYDVTTLVDASAGDVEAIAIVRAEAGLPVVS